MIKNLDQLADRLKGIKIGDKELTIDMLKESISSEAEIELDITQINMLNDSKLEEIKETYKKQGYEEARIPIKEMTMKELKGITGFEIEGYKEPKTFINAYKESILKQANIKPNEQIDELKGSLQTLQETYNTDIGLKDAEILGYKTKTKKIEIGSLVMGQFPDGLIGVNKKQASSLYQMDRQLDFDEGNLVIKKDGQILKDKFGKSIPVQDDINSFVSENKWLSVKGRGGGHEPGGSSKFETMDDLMKHMEKENIDPTDESGQKMIDDFNKAKMQA